MGSVHCALPWYCKSVVTKRQSFVRLGSSARAGKLRLKSGPRDRRATGPGSLLQRLELRRKKGGCLFPRVTGTNTDSHRWRSDLLEDRFVLLRGIMTRKSHEARGTTIRWIWHSARKNLRGGP